MLNKNVDIAIFQWYSHLNLQESMENSKNDRSSFIIVSLFIITAVIIGLFIAGFIFNKSKIDQLTQSLQETQKQVQDVKQQTEESKESVMEAKMEGLQDAAGAIKDVKNPAVRLALTKAYLASIRSQLTPANQKDLDSVIVYLEKNPNAIFVKATTLPPDVIQSVNNLKTAVKAKKIAGIMTMQKIDKAIYSPGEIINLTGTIQFVQDDEITGGSIFTLTDSETGYVYYLEFNEANSQTIKNSMLGETVKVSVKVTSKANEDLTFQVLTGPTPVAVPTQSSNSSPTPTTVQ